MSFQYMTKFINKICVLVDSKVLKKQWLAKTYARLWNPINYLVVGGIGTIINFLVWFILGNMFAWWITNTLAILTAFLWNWSNSVGPFGWVWGFKKREEKT